MRNAHGTLRQTVPWAFLRTKNISLYEYSVYQRLRAKSVIAFPLKPNPVGFLLVRNPKWYIDQPGMLVFLAYVLHRAMAQKKTMDSAKMHISPDNIQRDTDVIIHLFGNLDIYTSNYNRPDGCSRYHRQHFIIKAVSANAHRHDH